jgi:hypothetical protein
MALKRAGVKRSHFAGANLVQGGLFVVVATSLGYAAEGGKCPGTGAKQHRVALARIGYQPKGAAAAKFGVANFQTSAQPTYLGVLDVQV